MKKQRTSQEVAATQIARHLTLRIALIAFVVGCIALIVDFTPLHCVVLMMLAGVAGFAVGRAVMRVNRSSARALAGNTGMWSGLAYALPFMGLAAYRWFTIDEAYVVRRVSELIPSQIDLLRQQNVLPNLNYFQNEQVSMFFGYLIFGTFLGWLFGVIGGIVASRRG